MGEDLEETRNLRGLVSEEFFLRRDSLGNRQVTF